MLIRILVLIEKRFDFLKEERNIRLYMMPKHVERLRILTSHETVGFPRTTINAEKVSE
jgi:hypothetical protein